MADGFGPLSEKDRVAINVMDQSFGAAVELERQKVLNAPHPAWLAERCAFWQRQLRLEDWDVLAEFATQREIEGCSGQTNTVRDLKKARIRILSPDEQPPWSESTYRDDDPEQTLVHELLHLHLAYWVGEAENKDSPVFEAKEFAIDATASALVRLARGERR
jgi:hypothetical protein